MVSSFFAACCPGLVYLGPDSVKVIQNNSSVNWKLEDNNDHGQTMALHNMILQGMQINFSSL